ncbi:hypothetical protein CY34DRAFT_202583 [Suillus luteus UH-Slu-Lm8-n1]|uniref:Uncharacterized protein n=1 Tax=Suillus luteus UH-Slu-Lm8-n1 TaxID=930992 RepID=A0A0D0BDV2_9AGAM|nr:hypothetical protein CY34DRAFT_202583 [Suillus luteus UH-Slu-Lm8-n1]
MTSQSPKHSTRLPTRPTPSRDLRLLDRWLHGRLQTCKWLRPSIIDWFHKHISKPVPRLLASAGSIDFTIDLYSTARGPVPQSDSCKFVLYYTR